MKINMFNNIRKLYFCDESIIELKMYWLKLYTAQKARERGIIIRYGLR
ncbi:hypothetical protein DOT_0280 [Desulfosporosinus sp. OT]|nr:hypothetical protein DOT_0280 [Desulfosporosinus sp. OT]